MKTIVLIAVMASTALAGDCHIVRRQNIVVADTSLTIVPFAIATPVAVVAQGSPLYSYRDASAAYQPRAAVQSQSIDEQEYAAFVEWRKSRVQAASVPPSPFAANCQKCHSQGGAGFAHHDFSKPLTSDDKLAAIDAVVQGTMPKGRKLDPQVRADIVAELSKREKQVKAAVVPPQPQGESK